MSRRTSPIAVNDAISQASTAPSAPFEASIFGRMMSSSRVAPPLAPESLTSLRDVCERPTAIYNEYYNPFEPQRVDIASDYSPYVFGQPLFDDREVDIRKLPRGKSLSPATKKPKRSWVWEMGYHLIDLAHPKKPQYWACKRCHHDQRFSRHKEHVFNSNSLKNAEKHLLHVHYLNAGGDIWRMEATTQPTQPSGYIDGNPHLIIPFRQKEFKNAFLKWVILDDVKARKAASKHLKRMFRIANQDVINALPASSSTVATWIDQMFEYFEPELIAEVLSAQSRISITFDGWGSKREKLSIVAIVLHFINGKGDLVTRLAGLPELPGHGKTGIEQCSVILPLLRRFGITAQNIGWFVLDNATNNDTTLVELSKTYKFDPKQKRLRCVGHILNLIAEEYLFGQDSASFERDYKAAGAPARRQLWRQRGELGKLHNLVAHVIASGKRSELFIELQKE